jgi:hypothetical protein
MANQRATTVGGGVMDKSSSQCRHRRGRDPADGACGPGCQRSGGGSPAPHPGRLDSEVILYQLDTSSRVILITGRLLLNVLAVRQEKIVARWKM